MDDQIDTVVGILTEQRRALVDAWLDGVEAARPGAELLAATLARRILVPDVAGPEADARRASGVQACARLFDVGVAAMRKALDEHLPHPVPAPCAPRPGDH